MNLKRSSYVVYGVSLPINTLIIKIHWLFTEKSGDL
uniref:Uncharacterized protein n=1 Tax=Lepeophtheirus salmonis TaxID=72036 RepID=A0A0K2SZQ3_LEPSM